MLQPNDIQHVASINDLPDHPATGQQFHVDDPEVDRPVIWDGYNWRGDPTPEELAHGTEMWTYTRDQDSDAAQQDSNPDFQPCANCSTGEIISSSPPKVRFNCESCGGGIWTGLEEFSLPMGTPGPTTDEPFIKIVPKDENPDRTDVLAEAYELINGERAQTYGDCHESFDRIAALWTAYLDTVLTGMDVANLMVLLKVSRTKGTFHRDSYVDICGYAALAEKLAADEN
jgi:hypothetical protein